MSNTTIDDVLAIRLKKGEGRKWRERKRKWRKRRIWRRIRRMRRRRP